MSDTKPHPKKLEADALAAERKMERHAMKLIVKKATAEGVRYVEIAPFNYETQKPLKQGRMTIAYTIHHRNVVMVATSICHPDDQFDKLHGRALATVNLFNQRAILLRLPVSKGSSIKQALNDMFTHNTY